jgi:hypothetical protein
MLRPIADFRPTFNDGILKRLWIENGSVLFKNFEEPAKCFGSLPTALLL